MDEIKGVRFKCEVSVDVVELGIIVSHILSELGPFWLAKIIPTAAHGCTQGKAPHGCQIQRPCFTNELRACCATLENCIKRLQLRSGFLSSSMKYGCRQFHPMHFSTLIEAFIAL